MTTLIDDGLVEDNSDDSICLLDLEQAEIIDLDDIDDTIIEDHGFILEEPLDTYGCDVKEEFKSSYKKRSFMLPVTFFDINRNISLLKKCRPISIKIVDCEMYPWYYKKKIYKCNNTIVEKEDEAKTKVLSNDSVSHSKFQMCFDKKLVSPKQQPNIPKINISLEQTEAILKIKEEIEQYCKIKSNDDINFKLAEEKNKSVIEIPESNKINVDNFDTKIGTDNIEAYKTIAQTIVRNIDISKANSNLSNLVRSKENDNNICKSACDKDVEFVNLVNNGGHKKEKQKVTNKNITSPILPCREISHKEKLSKKSVTDDQSIRNNSNTSHCCNRMMHSSNKLIPHYHCKPIPRIPASNNINTNQMVSQNNNINKPDSCYLVRNTAINAPPNNNTLINNSTYNNDFNTDQHSQMRFKPSVNGVTTTSPQNFKQAYNNSLPYNWPLRNQYIVDNYFKNYNHIVNTPNSTQVFSYQDGIYFHKNSHATTYPDQMIIESRNNTGNINGTINSKENYRVSYQNPPPSYNESLYTRNSVYPIQYSASTNLRVPMQSNMATAQYIQKNPHTPTLNYNSNVTPQSYLPTLFKPTNSLQYPQNIPNNLSNYQPQFYPKLSQFASNLPLDLKVNDKTVYCIDKNGIENVKHRIETLNKVIASKTTCVDKNMSSAGSLSQPMVLSKKEAHGTTSRDNKCSRLINGNCMELKKILNSCQECEKYELRKCNKYNTELDNNIKLKNSQHTKPNTQNSGPVSSEIGYSPAILPIPTFKESFELLWKMQQYNQLNTANKNIKNVPPRDQSSTFKSSKEITDITRKRKLNDDEKKYDDIKKISIQEYK